MIVRWWRRLLVLVCVLLFGTLGSVKSSWVFADRAEISFSLADSPILGQATPERLNRALYEIFSDETLAGCFAEELTAEIEGNPGARRWLRRLLLRAGLEPTEDHGFRRYLMTVMAAHLGWRSQGSPAQVRSELLLFSPQSSRIHLYLGFDGAARLPVLSEASAKALNKALRRLGESRSDRWQKHVASAEQLLAARMQFLSAEIDRLGTESAHVRDRMRSGMAAAELRSGPIVQDLDTWLRVGTHLDLAPYLDWTARLRAAQDLPRWILTDLAALRTARQIQELLLDTDWLDATAFGARNAKASDKALALWLLPTIPEEQISHSKSRVVEPRGELLPTWSRATVGGALIGLSLALALLAFLGEMRTWRWKEASR